MIEKMKKVHLLMAEGDSEEFLDELQQLGVVHIESAGIAGDDRIIRLSTQISAYRKTLGELKSRAGETPGMTGAAIMKPEEIHQRVRELLSEEITLTAEADGYRKHLDLLRPWGRFDPALLTSLELEQIAVSFHILPLKVFSSTDFGNRLIEVVARDRVSVYFVEILHKGSPGTPRAPLFPGLRMPESAPEELETRLRKNEEQLLALDTELTLLAARRNILADEVSRLETDQERRMADLVLRSEADGEIRCLSGYIPVSLVSRLNKTLETRSILPLYTEPESVIETPVRLKNGPVAGLFEPITRIFGLPQYIEIDTTPFLAPFFAFFFGLCLADVGYGAIVTLAALAGFILLKNKAVKSLAALGFILGLTTIIGGLFLNTLFGMKIDGLPALPEWLASLLLFKDINDAMAFSIMLGVLQILVGFILQAVNRGRRLGPVGAIQPVGTFLLIVGAAVWVIGSVEPLMTVGPVPVGFWINSLGDTRKIGSATTIFGILLILLFNNPAKKIWMRPLFGLWEMYGIASGVPGDILSYIRLFALSLAGGLLGGAINLIATMIRGENPGILSWFFMLLVLVLGHSVNFALAALGAFVHPLRLTFVEFYKSVGFLGGGTAYAPYGGKTI